MSPSTTGEAPCNLNDWSQLPCQQHLRSSIPWRLTNRAPHSAIGPARRIDPRSMPESISYRADGAGGVAVNWEEPDPARLTGPPSLWPKAFLTVAWGVSKETPQDQRPPPSCLANGPIHPASRFPINLARDPHKPRHFLFHHLLPTPPRSPSRPGFACAIPPLRHTARLPPDRPTAGSEGPDSPAKANRLRLDLIAGHASHTF